MKADSPLPSRLAGRWVLAALLTGFLLAGAGCARHYTITTTRGVTLHSKGRPKLSGGYYLYRDADGREERINELQVREIAAQ